MIPCNSMFGMPSNTRFCDIWHSSEEMWADYSDSEIYDLDASNRLDEAHTKLLWTLLYSRYGNDAINAMDRNRFKYAVFTLIFQYGPSWVKKLDLQNKIRNLTEDEIARGTQAIYNHAYNPGTAPSTSTLTELTAINEQNTTNYKKSKLDGYTQQWDMLATDVTNEFLSKFKSLFSLVVAPIRPLLYTEYEEEDE